MEVIPAVPDLNDIAMFVQVVRCGSVAKAAQTLASAGLAPRLLIDCSHGDSAKDYGRQERRRALGA